MLNCLAQVEALAETRDDYLMVAEEWGALMGRQEKKDFLDRILHKNT